MGTINMAFAESLDGPWTKLLPDGAAFFDDANASLHTTNPVAWPLPNGTIVMAYRETPAIGIAVAPHWKGPYQRLYLNVTADNGRSDAYTRNYSLIQPDGVFNGTYERGGEDPFLWRDKRGTWRVVFHGFGGDDRLAGSFVGQTAYSTDLLHWTWQLEPIYSTTVQHDDGTKEVFWKRERPAIVLDEDGHPIYLLNGVVPEQPIYSNKSFSYIQATGAVKLMRETQDRMENT